MSLSLRKLAVSAVIVIAGSMVAENAFAGGCHSGGYRSSSHSSHSYSRNNYNHNHNTNYRASNHAAPQPQFGFTYVSCGHGLRVNYVAFGSVAYRLGLQCDDVIVALNHCPIRNGRDWSRELDKAMCQGGCVVLEVRKCSGPIEIMTVRFGAIIGGGQTPVIGAGGPGTGAQPQTNILNAPVEQVQPSLPTEQILSAAPAGSGKTGTNGNGEKQ